MNIGWLEIIIGTLFVIAVLTLLVARGKSWLEPQFWKIPAIASPIVMGTTLVILTVDTSRQISMGSGRVPSPTVINKEIGYVYDSKQQAMVPEIGKDIGFFGKIWSEKEALELITKGKLVIQSRNCMNCHTFLGNGAYYAPDLTKSWLDPAWEDVIMGMTEANTKEEAIKIFLMNSDKFATWERKMPNLSLSENEAIAVVAYLKWMSAINTNGFPPNFPEVKVSRSDLRNQNNQ